MFGRPLSGRSLGRGGVSRPSTAAAFIDLATGNLLPNHDAFDSWGALGVSVSANATQGVNGLTADLITEDSSSGEHRLNQGPSLNAGNYQYILYAKAGLSGSRGVGLDVGVNDFSGGCFVKFAIDGTVTEAAGTYGSGFSAVSASSAMSINGYRRFVLNFTLGSNITSYVFAAFSSSGSGNYAGDGSSSLYFAGATLKAV